jgi:raffinose/stachyose/melibiose transport system permease protein
MTSGARHVLLVVAATLFAAPIGVMLLTAMQKPGPAGSLGPLTLEPRRLTLANFTEVIGDGELYRFLINSAIVSTVSTLLVLGAGSSAAFGLFKFEFPGKRPIFLLLLLGVVLPPAAMIVPLYGQIRSLGLLDSYLGLILPYAALGIPVAVLLFTNSFSAVPSEILQAATVDGARPFQVFVRILVPLSLPAVATVGILQVLFSWNEYLLASLVMIDEERQTAQLAWIKYAGQFNVQYQRLFGVLTVLTVPVVAVFLLLQRQFVRGLQGALK